jgi:hypothetical protein
LLNAWVCIWIQFYNPAVSQGSVVNVSLSDFNLRTWNPTCNCISACFLVKNTPLRFTLILLESSIDNQIIAPTSDTLHLLNSNSWDCNQMVTVIWATNSAESYWMSSFVEVALNFNVISIIPWPNLINRFSIQGDKSYWILNWCIWKNSVVKGNLDLPILHLILSQEAFSRVRAKDNIILILNWKVQDWWLLGWKTDNWWLSERENNFR